VYASLLSENVEQERDEGGQVRFRVRALFHTRGETSTHGTCIILHAFKETEQHKASCITQVRINFSGIFPYSFISQFPPSFFISSSCFPASSRAMCGNPDSSQ